VADEYPLSNFHFQVEWGGATLGFHEVSGLDVRSEVRELGEGASNEYEQPQVTGARKYDHITMKRGVFVGDIEFYEWWESVARNSDERHDLTITLLNEEYEPMVILTVKNAWAKELQSTVLKVESNEVAIVALELAHEGLTIQSE
jgi:phage tail-like protein